MIEFYWDGELISRHKNKEKAFEKAYEYHKKHGFKCRLSMSDFRDAKTSIDYGLFAEFHSWFYAPIGIFEKESLFLDSCSESLLEFNDQ
jgi:hypothetical protein